MPASFLVGLRVEGRRCLVLGDDDDAATRARSLADAGAHVVRFASAGGASDPRIEQVHRGVAAADLVAAFLVVSTPRDPALSQWLYEHATAHADGFLLCCIDQPEYCTFVHVASVRRGPLQIAVATDGVAPSVAAAIRRALDAQLGSDLGTWIETVAALRARTPVHARSEALRRALEGFVWKVSYELPSPSTDG